MPVGAWYNQILPLAVVPMRTGVGIQPGIGGYNGAYGTSNQIMTGSTGPEFVMNAPMGPYMQYNINMQPRSNALSEYANY
jgi:hypothetical protein